MPSASLAQLAEHALRKRTVVGSIPTRGLLADWLRIIETEAPSQAYHIDGEQRNTASTQLFADMLR